MGQSEAVLIWSPVPRPEAICFATWYCIASPSVWASAAAVKVEIIWGKTEASLSEKGPIHVQAMQALEEMTTRVSQRPHLGRSARGSGLDHMKTIWCTSGIDLKPEVAV